MCDFTLQEDYKNVKYIVSKRFDGKIQIVLQDDDGQQSSKVAMEIFADLKSGRCFLYAVLTMFYSVRFALTADSSREYVCGLSCLLNYLILSYVDVITRNHSDLVVAMVTKMKRSSVIFLSIPFLNYSKIKSSYLQNIFLAMICVSNHWKYRVWLIHVNITDVQNGGMKYGITEVKAQTTAGGGSSSHGGSTSAHTGMFVGTVLVGTGKFVILIYCLTFLCTPWHHITSSETCFCFLCRYFSTITGQLKSLLG